MNTIRLTYVVALVALFGSVFLYFGWQTDDAFISRTVAKNFVENSVWAWDSLATKNESATTSPLHVGYVSVFYRLVGADNVAKAEATLNVILFFIVVIWIYIRLGAGTERGVFLAALVAAPYSVFWLLAGLETGIVTVLYTFVFAQLFFWLLDRQAKPPSRPLVFLLSAVRPDYFVCLLAISWAVYRKETLRSALIYCIPILLALVTYYSCLKLFLGSVLPASFYFKVDQFDRLDLFRSGMSYLRDYWAWSIWLPPILIVLAALELRTRDDRRNLITFAIAVAIVPAVVVLNGGDWMAGFRFFAPVLVIFNLFVFLLVERWLSRKSFPGHDVIFAVAFLIFLSNLIGPFHNILGSRESEYNLNFYELVIGNRDRIPLDPDESYVNVYGDLVGFLNENADVTHIGLSEAGYIAFTFARNRTDIQGLTMLELAKVRSLYGINSPNFISIIQDRGITHFLFWLKEQEGVFRPRVAREVFDHFYPSGITIAQCTYHSKVEDVYRYTHGSRGPLYLCVLPAPEL